MKTLLYLFLFLTFTCFSQQEFEICENNNTVTYSTTIDMNGTIQWFLNGNFIGQGANINITYDNVGDYQLVAVGANELGCEGIPVVLNIIVTKCDPLIYWVPNSFTPDGNEFNQVWGPTITNGISIEGFVFEVYNRWGELIWQSFDPEIKWDGTYNNRPITDGTYLWKMTFKSLKNGEKQVVSGYVTIIK
jgi:gliding motility-associated-like protein